MDMYISEELSKVFLYTKEEAMRTGTYQISPGHMLLGILRHENCEACRILMKCGADLTECKKFLDAKLFTTDSIPYCDEDKITLSRNAENTFSMTMLEASMSGDAAVSSIHLLLALSRCTSDECKAYFKFSGIDYCNIKSHICHSDVIEPQECCSAEESMNVIRDELISVVELIGKGKQILS